MTTTLNPEIKTLSNIQDSIKLRKSSEAMSLEQKINALKENQGIMDFFTDKLNVKLPSLIKVLESLHLGILTIGYSKTGRTEDWTETDSLHVFITALPLSDKFKFITDKGYTAGGAGKNNKQLEDKAAKLVAKIKESIGIESVYINKYSLEIKDGQKTGTVMIDLWIK